MATFSVWNKQFIAGEWREGRSKDSYEDKNPYNDETLVYIRLANLDDINDAYESAKRVQKEWAQVNPYERSRIMERAAELLSQRRQELIDIITTETGSSVVKANVEIDFAMAIIKEAATFPIRMRGHILPSLIPGKENRIYRNPAGVVGVISPFNFPFYLSMRSVAPALATGNGVVLKPDSQTMIAGGLYIGKLFEDAGIPKGLLNVVVFNTGEIGDAFVEHPIPRIISFTGSTQVGRHIGELCGRNLKRVALELGGNNAMIVLADADVEKAAGAAAFGKFMHAGQICMAINRVIVDQTIYEPFLETFVRKAKAIPCGDQSNPETIIGPLINAKQVSRILALIEKSKSEGAKVALEGSVNGNVMSPFVLRDVTNEMTIAQEEIFGPVASVIAAKDEEDAIRIANDSPYGLSGAVYGGRLEHAVEVAKRIETGMIHVNDQSVNDEPIIAFGGEKSSGLGRYGGEWALDEFTTVKWVSVQIQDRTYPF
ncbi:aldehyde dehydrogenase family protein [Brevibacillus thermoruber]|uniref:aldehyde dehydrogenase family protein n=1 Tax=Brevibacillus thermoruber TaxID=33942 RepID=UPI004042796C